MYVFNVVIKISCLEPNRERNEFNKPYKEAKDRQANDALAVEATGMIFRPDYLYEHI